MQICFFFIISNKTKSKCIVLNDKVLLSLKYFNVLLFPSCTLIIKININKLHLYNGTVNNFNRKKKVNIEGTWIRKKK